MNSPVKDPRSLTKEKLKNELSNHNIALPPSDSKKEVYVDLYRQHILAPATSTYGKSRNEVDRYKARLEALSSDEDEEEDTAIKTKKKMAVNGDADPLTADEVDSLTDDELYMALARRGETVGPILDSTRRVYRKKLKRLLTDETDAAVTYSDGGGQRVENGHEEDEFSDQDDDEEPMETEVVPTYTTMPSPEPPRPTRLIEHRAPNPTPTLSRATSSGRVPVNKATVERQRISPERQRMAPPSDDKPVITQRFGHKSNKTNSSDNGKLSPKRGTKKPEKETTQGGEETLASIKSHHQQLKKRQGMSIWMQLGIIAVCAIVVFLVLSNMEPAFDNPLITENKKDSMV